MGVEHKKINTALYYVKGGSFNGESSKLLNSYQLLLDKQEDWVDVGIYGEAPKDYRDIDMPPELCRLCKSAKEGKVDLIITQKINLFHRDIATALRIAGELADLPNPVEVFFQTENLSSIKDKETMDVLSECIAMSNS